MKYLIGVYIGIAVAILFFILLLEGKKAFFSALLFSIGWPISVVVMSLIEIIKEKS